MTKRRAVALAALLILMALVVYVALNRSAVRAAVSRGTYDQDLRVAAERHDLKEVKALLKMGADVNATNRFGWTPLHCAARSGYVHVVRYLVDRGAHSEAADGEGQTPLLLAVRNGRVGVVEYLAKHGANVNAAENEGWTPLQIAWDDEIREILIRHGAKPEE